MKIGIYFNNSMTAEVDLTHPQNGNFGVRRSLQLSRSYQRRHRRFMTSRVYLE
jgi:hypothetical protein